MSARPARRGSRDLVQAYADGLRPVDAHGEEVWHDANQELPLLERLVARIVLGVDRSQVGLERVDLDLNREEVGRRIGRMRRAIEDIQLALVHAIALAAVGGRVARAT